MALIQIDTEAPAQELRANSPDAALVRRMVAQWVKTLQFVHGGTPDEAIAAAADAARPDADGALGGVRRIRATQARLIDSGGFLTTGASPRWLPSGSRTKALLADMSTWTAEEITAAPPIRALDGTNYTWNTLARVTAALRALVAQERAIIAAGNAAVTAFRAAQAAEQAYDFEAIAWPAVYTPPAPPPDGATSASGK